MKLIPIKSLLAVSVFAVLASCGNNQSESDGTVPDQYADFERVPLSSKIENVQPMTGIVLWTSLANPVLKKDLQLEYTYMGYDDICKEKDVFDWTPLDEVLDAVAGRGNQLIVRFHYTYVGQETTTPDYIKAMPDYEETVGLSEGRETHFPDWRCEELQRFHKEFYKRFAERYDKDPRLAFLQTGFGLWGEYHIYDGPFELGRTFPSKEFQTEFFQGMETWFDDTTWSISIDAADDTYAPFRKNASLLDLRFGNFDDSFMCEDHDGYNRQSWKFFGEKRYMTAPFGGEFSYYTDEDQEHALDPEGMHGMVFEDEAAYYHMTYIIGNDQPSYQTPDRIIEASMSMGYKFAVKDFRINDGKAAILIANTGAAPIYRDAYVALEGARGDYNLRNLMPGEEKWVEVTSSGITSSSVPEIVCDHLVEGQKIEYDADVR